MSPDQYFAPRPAVPSSRATVRLTLPDLTLDLVTDRGVFSHGAVDAGTRYLLMDGPRLPTVHGGDRGGPVQFLDLGCGYGPIAAVLQRRSPDAIVWAVDVNERALELCRENAPGVRVDPPDDVTFDTIWSNPPIRIGKGALHDLLRAWLPRLAPGGYAALVVQKHLGSDSLQRWLTDDGWHVERIGSRQGYRLLQVQRP